MADITQSIEKLEKDVFKLSSKVKKIQNEKEWHTSIVKKLTHSFITYLFTVSLLYSINYDDYLVDALIPTAVFFVAQFVTPVVKSLWIRRKNR